MHLHQLTASEASRRIRAAELSSYDYVEATLRRIEAVEPAVGAFVSVDAERALDAARRSDELIASGKKAGPLQGVPVGIKDIIDVADHPTGAGSKVRHDHRADCDSAVVERLRAAGAIILGKTHTHEFALGVTTPATRNPWNLDYIPGGSSGGSAAAIAAGEIPLALGTDTGGSIRGPASLCGVVGFKPTYGRVPNHGVVPLSWSLDHVGALARTVEDAALLMEAIQGADPRDPMSAQIPTVGLRAELEDGVQGIRVGTPTNHFVDDVDPDVAAQTKGAVDLLTDAGAASREMTLPMAELYLPALFGIALPECASYHRRTLLTRNELYGDDIRTLLEASIPIPATTYVQALRMRRLITRAWRELFSSVDVIVAPTQPAPAVPVGQEVIRWSDEREESLAQAYSRFTGPANLTGYPSISVPGGLSSSGLPIGVQIIGRPFEEGLVLRVARALEAGTVVAEPTIGLGAK